MADQQISEFSPSSLTVSKLEISTSSNNDIDCDDDEFHPGYSECTCIRYKLPSPPPPLVGEESNASTNVVSTPKPQERRPLPPPPPPPSLSSATSQETAKVVDQMNANDVFQFPANEKDFVDYNAANPTPRFRDEPESQYQQLRKYSSNEQEECQKEEITRQMPPSTAGALEESVIRQGDSERHPWTSPKDDPENGGNAAIEINTNSSAQSPGKRLKTILRSSAKFNQRLDIEKSQRPGTSRYDIRYRSRSISPPSTSADSDWRKTTIRRQTESKKNKDTNPAKVRVALYYTWSFSSQHRQRPNLPQLGSNQQRIADPYLSASQHYRTYSTRTPIISAPPFRAITEARSPAIMPRHQSGKRSRSMYSTTPRNPNRSTAAEPAYSSRTLRPSHYCHTPSYSCYSTITDTPNAYRNIFPYTTMYRSPAAYQYPHQQHPQQPYAYYGQYANPADFTRSLRRQNHDQHRYHSGSTTGPALDPNCNRTGFDIYVTEQPYHHCPGAYFNNGPASSSSPPVNVVPSWIEDPTTEGEKMGENSTSAVGDNESGVFGRNRCASRACLVGWMLALTAVIILALAIGLFIQISRESTRFEQLQRRQSTPPEGTSTFSAVFPIR